MALGPAAISEIVKVERLKTPALCYYTYTGSIGKEEVKT
jgi:hypothetical protein